MSYDKHGADIQEKEVARRIITLVCITVRTVHNDLAIPHGFAHTSHIIDQSSRKITWGSLNVKKICLVALIMMLFSFTESAFSSGNSKNDSFRRSKRTLLTQVYNSHKLTLYCEADFDDSGNITLPDGFTTPNYTKRAQRLEWEHVVAAEKLGQRFPEWKQGHPQCVDSKGKPYKGRRCAEKISEEYRFMQADLYNLYPSIGAVNARRSNYDFALLPDEEVDFGSCPMKIAKAEPPVESRGQIARTYLYMVAAYPHVRLKAQLMKLMNEWDEAYPVNEWECSRAKQIENIQGNPNLFVKKGCEESGLW